MVSNPECLFYFPGEGTSKEKGKALQSLRDDPTSKVLAPDAEAPQAQLIAVSGVGSKCGKTNEGKGNAIKFLEDGKKGESCPDCGKNVKATTPDSKRRNRFNPGWISCTLAGMRSCTLAICIWISAFRWISCIATGNKDAEGCSYPQAHFESQELFSPHIHWMPKRFWETHFYPDAQRAGDAEEPGES